MKQRTLPLGGKVKVLSREAIHSAILSGEELGPRLVNGYHHAWIEFQETKRKEETASVVSVTSCFSIAAMPGGKCGSSF